MPRWQREVSERFRDKDEDALEIVTALLSRIMMRHTKEIAHKQVQLPPQTCEEVLVNFDNASSRAMYLAIEAHCQNEAQRMMSHKDPARWRSDLLLLKELLQCAAVDAAVLRLDDLERTLQLADDAPRLGEWFLGGRRGLYGEKRILRQWISEQSPDRPGLPALKALLQDASKGSCQQTCGLCGTNVLEIPKPVIVHCCLSLFCEECATEKLQATARAGPSRAAQTKCPFCRKDLTALDYICLRTPLDTRNDGGSSSSAHVPSFENAKAALSALPSYDSLRELKVWECDGAYEAADGKPEWGCVDGKASRKPCPYVADGLHFCTKACMEKLFERSLLRNPGDGNGLVCRRADSRQGTGWAGAKLAGKTFATTLEAKEKLQQVAEKLSEEKKW